MKDNYKVLATKKIDREPLYWFLGGLCYKKGNLSFETDSKLEYPFTTYYNYKIESQEFNGDIYRPLAEIKLPILLFQFSDNCIVSQISPVIDTEEGKAYPFIGFNSDEQRIEIILPETITVKEKEAEWLGKGKKREVNNPNVEDYELNFEEFEDWREAVGDFYNNNIFESSLRRSEVTSAFERAKKTLYRSWDDELGTFLQLPWRQKSGFAACKYSYSLLSNEAIRLNYFEDLYRSTGDEEFKRWYMRLKGLFKDNKLYIKELRKGEGLIWYNTLDFNGKDLEGEFYLGTGYYGYPGGQATISFNLLEFLDRRKDEELERLVKENLRYIVSTQKENGSWPLALNQEKELPFKRENYEEYVSQGATGECVRSLLKGYSRFGIEEFKEAAIKGLESLKSEHPICYNGLRDIGINEVEAFSTFSVVNAFLDAYKEFGEDEYLENARNYASYLLTWNYWFEADGRDLRGINHPISESITMRISPYETLLASKLYKRLSKYLEDEFWEGLSEISLEKVLEYVNDTGGLSEGIFFDFRGNLKKLHTEQTFATSELLHTLDRFASHANGGYSSSEDEFDSRRKLDLIEEEGNIIIPDLKFVFDMDKFGLESLAGIRINSQLFFEGPYSKRAKTKSKILEMMRGDKKVLLGLRDLDFVWSGIKPRKREFDVEGFSEVVKRSKINVEDSEADFRVESDIHRIEGSLKAYNNSDKAEVVIDFQIKTKKHDIYCNKVFFKFPGFEEDNGTLRKENLGIRTDDLAKASDEVLDLTMSSNWTQGGIFNGKLVIEIQKD